MSVLLDTYRTGDSDIHEYITVERLSMPAVRAVPLWAAKQWTFYVMHDVIKIGTVCCMVLSTTWFPRSYPLCQRSWEVYVRTTATSTDNNNNLLQSAVGTGCGGDVNHVNRSPWTSQQFWYEGIYCQFDAIHFKLATLLFKILCDPVWLSYVSDECKLVL